MRRIILYTAASIDAMIARSNGSVGWLDSPRFRMTGEDFGFASLLRSIDTTIMGHTIYRQMRSFGTGLPGEASRHYVLTRSSTRRPAEGVRFLSVNILPTLRKLRSEKGKHIWLVGGGEINTVMMNAGLVDTIVLTTIPVVLGNGIPLFTAKVRPAQFRLKKRIRFANGFVQSIWDRR